jgi:hypothetical protein
MLVEIQDVNRILRTVREDLGEAARLGQLGILGEREADDVPCARNRSRGERGARSCDASGGKASARRKEFAARGADPSLRSG